MGFLVVNIPKRRKGIFLANKNEVKTAIENETKTTLRINEGVEIDGTGEGLLLAADVVKAIGRGFNQKTAFLLFDDENVLESITLEGETKATRERLFARVIGRNGRVKKDIENLTKTHVCIYGKTISVIGEMRFAGIARKAIEILINGKPHASMYVFLKKELKKV